MIRSLSLLALGALLGACHPKAGEPAVDAVVPAFTAEAALPQSAPGVVLLVQLGADGHATVEGTVQGELYVDVDAAEEDDYAFRTQVLDANDQVLYSRGTPAPIQVRDFLGYYTDETGYDILSVFPFLGNFPVIVPLLDGASRVRFQIREAGEDYKNVGSYTLDQIAADEQGTSDAVTGFETLADHGPSANRLDIVLVGDGFTAEEQDLWREEAADLSDTLLSTEPFASMADYINVHRVDAVSAESGVSYDCVDECRVRDTAFGTVFALEWINSLLGTDYDTRAVFQSNQWEVARAASVVPWDMVIVVGNTSTFGGMAVHYATVTTASPLWTNTGVHELSHALGLLGDEYVSDACIVSDANGLPPNITDEGESPPWSQWIDADTPLPTPDDLRDGTVGAYQGAYNCRTLYRPRWTCRMRDSQGEQFCPVCAEQLVRRVLRFADPADGLSLSDQGDALLISLDAPRVDLRLAAEVDGVEVAAGSSPLSVPADALAGGARLVVRASLETDLVRVEEGELSQAWAYDLSAR